METLEEWLVKELTKRHASITTAESCTGGLVSGRIVNVGGASSVFNQSFVTYSNEAKRDLLGVKQETLDSVGAVSPETAEQMARAILLQFPSIEKIQLEIGENQVKLIKTKSNMPAITDSFLPPVDASCFI